MFFSFAYVGKCCKYCSRSSNPKEKWEYQKELLVDLEAMQERANIALENAEISRHALGEISKNIMSLILLCYACDETQAKVCELLTIENVLVDESELEKRAKKNRDEKKGEKVVAIDSKKNKNKDKDKDKDKE